MAGVAARRTLDGTEKAWSAIFRRLNFRERQCAHFPYFDFGLYPGLEDMTHVSDWNRKHELAQNVLSNL